MTPLMTSAVIAGMAAFLASVVLTPLMRGLARRTGGVAKPKNDRWHTRPTAKFGGVAIFVAVMLPLLLLLPSTRESRIVLAAGYKVRFALAAKFFPPKSATQLRGGRSFSYKHNLQLMILEF